MEKHNHEKKKKLNYEVLPFYDHLFTFFKCVIILKKLSIINTI